MDLGPSLWTFNGFGPLFLFSLLEAQMFYFPGLQSFVLFWELVQHCDFFGPQQMITPSYIFIHCQINWIGV